MVNRYTNIEANFPKIIRDEAIILDDECFIAGGFLHRLTTGGNIKEGDLDLFVVHGRSSGSSKLRKMCDTLKEHGYTLSIFNLTIKAVKKGEIDIQIVPVNFSTPQMIIDNFDLSCVGLAYYSGRLITSVHYDKYNGPVVCDKDSLSNKMIAYCPHNRILKHRLEKYSKQGYSILLSPFTTVVSEVMPLKNELEIDDFIKEVFDMRVEGQNVKDVYEYRDVGTSHERISPPSAECLVGFCNSLSGGHILNPYITKEEFNDIIKNPYERDHVITPRLSNDVAFGILNRMYHNGSYAEFKEDNVIHVFRRDNPYHGK